MNKEQYVAQVALLLDCLPVLKDQSLFALKGGTAINFFICDLPRLSVDIDLTFLKTTQRNEAISEIENGLRTMGELILKRNPRYKINEIKTRDGILQKIIVVNGLTKIKIEPNFTIRGTLLPIVKIDIKKSVENRFLYSVKNIPVLSEAELYAGKICAALSRQHPRDFFDVKELLDTQGITEQIREAFVVYLACSPRPMHELLQPNLINLRNVYKNEFVNMTEKNIPFESLLETRDKLIKTINHDLLMSERKFLLSIKNGTPDYTLLSFSNLDQFPALRWKLINIKKIDRKKHSLMIDKLKTVLNI
ncbi:MAG: nucleotidyl transferase AbiEii/AbiGii toxin family protein [Gammaproteobacteria bacterium]|nr:nucleotidyl transferase AbiEii/AbiGii toxin family protein [Gammaproteobacteria bacterium]